MWKGTTHLFNVWLIIDSLSYGTASSSPLLDVWSIYFYSNVSNHDMYWPHYSFSSTNKFSSVICIRGLSSGPFLLRKYFFQDISRTFSDIVKFQDISRTWKMNLLFSRFSRTRGNLQSDVFTRISSNVMTNNLICSCLGWPWLWPDVSFQLHTSNLRSTFGR